jgi:hypothetical protein
LHRAETELVQLVGRFLDGVDLCGGEAVTGVLGPIGDAVGRVEVEAQSFDLLCPIRAGLDF